MRLINHAHETENIIKSQINNNGIYIVPAFTGLGAPYWSPDSRGIITGITRNTDWNYINAIIIYLRFYNIFSFMSMIN